MLKQRGYNAHGCENSRIEMKLRLSVLVHSGSVNQCIAHISSLYEALTHQNMSWILGAKRGLDSSFEGPYKFLF